MNQATRKELERIAQNLRIVGLKMVQKAHSGHIGGAFSVSEIMAVLYFDKMNIRPEEPGWEERIPETHGREASLLINARVEIPAEDLSRLVQTALLESGIEFHARDGRAFHPPQPNPTHRMP